MDNSSSWMRESLKTNQPSWTPLLSSMISSGILPSRSLNRSKCSPEVQSFTFSPSSQDPTHPNLMVTAALSPHTPDQSFLFSKYKVQQSMSPHFLLDHLSGSCYQCTPETSWIACTLMCCPSSRYWGVWLDSHRDLGQRLKDFFQISEDSFV